MGRWIKVAAWLRRTKIVESKKVKPFQRFNMGRLDVGLTSYEKFVFFIVFACGVIEIVYGVLAICGINH